MTVVTIALVIAFITFVAGNGNSGVAGVGSDPSNISVTTIARPSLPGDDTTESTLGGSSARCKDGTYSFKGGDTSVSDDELCKSNGGVEERLP